MSSAYPAGQLSLKSQLAASHLRESLTQVIDGFAKNVRTEISAARGIEHAQLVAGFVEHLSILADALEQGESGTSRAELAHLGTAHGRARANLRTYALDDLIMEYRIFGEVIFRALRVRGELDEYAECAINNAIQRGLAHSTVAFTREQLNDEMNSFRQELKRVSLQLRSIADSVPIHLLHLDKNERFLFANRSAAKMWRRPVEQLVGKSIRDVVGEVTHRAIKDYTRRVLQGETVSYESPFQFPDGAIHTFLNTYTPTREEDGSIQGFIATGTDITHRKKVEASLSVERHKLEAIFRGSPAAMALWRGPEMIFEMVNPGYQQLFPDRELLGKPFLEALPEFVGQPFYDMFMKVLQTGAPIVGEEVLARHRRTLDGPIEDRYYDFAYVRIEDAEGNPYGVYDHAIDVTDRVLARRALEESRAELMASVQELKKERELREHFVATLTHDLRTPLTAAKISAQVIGRRAADSPETQKLATRVVDNIDRTDHMIRDLLDANRIKAGEKLAISVEALSLNRTVSDVLEELSTIHGDRFVLHAHQEIKGYWSKSALRRILENLCNNAIKYGHSHAPVTVSLTAHDGKAWIAVHNKGPAISLQDQTRLFEPFKRTASALRGGQRGWGLGLPLVKGFAEAHGGTVGVESSPERGTTFRVSLLFDARATAS